MNTWARTRQLVVGILLSLGGVTNPAAAQSPRWVPLPLGNTGPITSIDVAKNQNGKLEVFGVTQNNNVWHIWQDGQGSWTYWERLYNSNDKIWFVRAASNKNGELELFGIAPFSNSVWHTYQTAPNNGWNGSWLNLNGGIVSSLEVGQNEDGRLEVFGIAPTYPNSLWHIWQDRHNAIGGWHRDWQPLGWHNCPLSVQNFQVIRNIADKLEVFAVIDNASSRCNLPNSNVWRIEQTAKNDGWNDMWTPVAPQYVSIIEVVKNDTDQLELFGETHPFTLHTWQDLTGKWGTSWVPLDHYGDALTYLRAEVDHDYRVNLFGIAPNNVVWHTRQEVAGRGPWLPWELLHQPGYLMKSLDVIQGSGDGLWVFGIDMSGRVWYTWQVPPSYAWNQ